MSPATLLLIIQGVQAAIKAAPQVVDIVVKSKDFISSLFHAGLITAEQQDKVHAHIDALCAAYAAGEVPPEFTVEADPV